MDILLSASQALNQHLFPPSPGRQISGRTMNLMTGRWARTVVRGYRPRLFVAGSLLTTTVFVIVGHTCFTMKCQLSKTLYWMTPSSSSRSNSSQLEAVDNDTVALASRPSNSGGYVTFGGGFGDGRGLGNQLFDFATVVYVAELAGRRPAILKFDYTIGLDHVFDLRDVDRFDDLCPCYDFNEAKSLTFDSRLDEVARADNAATRNRSIVVWGFWQSWKYTRSVDRRLRRHLLLLPKIEIFAADYFARTVPPSWRGGFTRVGIHVRRGDVVGADKVQFGYSTPTAKYFRKAMNYFTDRYDRVQFVVASNDADWTYANVKAAPNASSSTVNVMYTPNLDGYHDFAILSLCDHIIMSTGTFGWWAAWLAKGTTIYYKNWPIVNTTLYRMFKYDDYFPPGWIPMGD